MILYVLTAGAWEDYRVIGVFSSREKARAAWSPVAPDGETFWSYAWDGDRFKGNDYNCAQVEEYVLDSD